jgi:predicted DNA-binding protein
MGVSMAKSVRFDSQLESRLERAARALGVSQSELIREAIAKRCEELLRPSLAKSLAPFIGRIKSSGGRARHTGVAFRRALTKKRTR